MTYSDALTWLFALPDWERGTGKRPTREQLFLERPAALLEALGNPQARFRSVLVAGTKGKGSTAAMLESILRAAGMKTGLYTSPHLHTYRERIRAGGSLITEAEFARGVGEMQTLVGELNRARPELEAFTTFEVTTAMTLDYFARVGIDVAILEVGLGGRLDATNVVDADLSVITPISFDHAAVLGDTLPKIAYEKAGIIKVGKTVLSAPQTPDALAVIEQVARAKNATLAASGRDWLWLGDHDGYMVAGEPRAGLWRNYWLYDNLRVPLRGVHQLENAALAVAAAHTIRELWEKEMSIESVREGLANTVWAGRIEVAPPRDTEQPRIVMDGAHNGESAEKLWAALKFHFEFDKLFLILGALADKDVDSIISPFLSRAEFVWTVKTNHPRSRGAEDLALHLRTLGSHAQAADDVDDALARARERASPRDLILITGSLSVVAQARRALGLAQEQDPPL